MLPTCATVDLTRRTKRRGWQQRHPRPWRV